VRIAGAKNAALPCLAASLLTEESLRLRNLPEVWDVDSMIRLLQTLEVELDEREERSATLRASGRDAVEAPYELVRKMRASVLVLGPLLARRGAARVSMPGGCAIGARPIDRHLEALGRLGAEIRVEHGYVEARADRLRGAEITFEDVTVTGTENVLMAATLAKGRTVLRRCACEPEVEDLGRLLQAMGAQIEGLGTDTLVIEGVDELGGAEHAVIPDRIEAGTYLVAAGVTGGEVVLEEVEPAHMVVVLEHLRRVGMAIEEGDRTLAVRNAGPLRGLDMRTEPYPGFPTDMQAQWMLLMTQAGGSARVAETIFEARFMHVAELLRMGAHIALDGGTATVEGPTPLTGAEVTASDLRASACLVLAGLAARGETLVHRVYHLDRGYERIEHKLEGLGAQVERLTEERP